MDITEVRVKLMDDPYDRLQGFCSITFDRSFVIRDLKIIQGAKGSFVAMPSRKLTDRCPNCNTKNHLRSLHCNQCGARLYEERATKDEDGRDKLYADIAHPINSECREMIQRRVLEAYEEELVKSSRPNYVCTYDDYGEDRFATLHESEPVQTVSHVGGEETSLRIEPAASPGPPHHNVAASRERAAAATDGIEQHGGKGDSFGAGIS